MAWPPPLPLLVDLAFRKLVDLAFRKLVFLASRKLVFLACRKVLPVCSTAPLATVHLFSTALFMACKWQAVQVALPCKGRLGQLCGCEASRSERRFRTYTHFSWATTSFPRRAGLGQTALAAHPAMRGSLSRRWKKRLAQ